LSLTPVDFLLPIDIDRFILLGWSSSREEDLLSLELGDAATCFDLGLSPSDGLSTSPSTDILRPTDLDRLILLAWSPSRLEGLLSLELGDAATCFDFLLSSADGLSSSSSEDTPEDTLLPTDFDRLIFEEALLPIDIDRFILVDGSSSRDVDRPSRGLQFPNIAGDSLAEGFGSVSEATGMACLFRMDELIALLNLAKESSASGETTVGDETLPFFVDDWSSTADSPLNNEATSSLARNGFPKFEVSKVSKDFARAGGDFWKTLVGSSSNTPNENTSWVVCDNESALKGVASFGNFPWVDCDSEPNLGVIDIFDALSFLAGGCAFTLGIAGGYNFPTSIFPGLGPTFPTPLATLLPRSPPDPGESAELLLEVTVGTVPSEPSPNSASSVANMLFSSSSTLPMSWFDSESNLANKLGTSLFVSSLRVTETLRLRTGSAPSFAKLRPWRPDALPVPGMPSVLA
jgi:hypothetical protein